MTGSLILRAWMSLPWIGGRVVMHSPGKVGLRHPLFQNQYE